MRSEYRAGWMLLQRPAGVVRAAHGFVAMKDTGRVNW